jgi:hypothetical protein
MEFKCTGCDYTSLYKICIINHIKKKKKCSDNPTIIEVHVKKIKCEFCGKDYKTKNTLVKHMKICNNNKQQNMTINNQTINNQTINNTTNNTTNNNTINNYITISLTPYNDPNMEGMQEYLEKAIKKTLMSIPSIIENVHFNDKYPENKNISITNKRENRAKVFNGKRWETVDKGRLITNIVDTYERELTNYAEEQGNTKFIENYETAKKQKNAEKELVDTVHNVIYDNSNKVNTKIIEVQKELEILD